MLFYSIPYDGGVNTIRLAYDRIIERAYQMHLAQRRWSLAELSFDADDYQWLCNWASCLDWSFLGSFLGRERQYDVAFGLLFLAFCTEVARREVMPGTVWEPIRTALPRDLIPYLFPNIARLVIERAARRCNLRHAFDVEGGKNWMITIHLQFGFHYAALPDLANWLQGFNIPDGMGHLLGRGSLLSLSSESFQALLRDLKLFRRRYITRHELLHRVANSPWLLAEHHEALLAAALRNYTEEESSGEDIAPCGGLPPFVGPPRLVFTSTGSRPSFRVPLINLDSQSWEGRSAEIAVGELILAELVRRDDGSWYALDGNELTLPPSMGPVVSLCCRNAQGEAITFNEITLWNRNAIVNVYDNSGELIPDGQPLSPARRYWLLVGADLTLTPEAEEHFGFGPAPQHATLHAITGATDHDWVLSQAGVPLWSTRQKKCTPVPVVALINADWEKQSQIGPAEQPSVSVELPSGAQMLFARGLGVPLSFVFTTSTWVVGPLPCLAGTLPARVQIQIGYQDQDGCIHLSKVVLEASRLYRSGILVFHRDVWSDARADAAGCCTIQDAATMPLRVFPPSSETAYLFESAAWVGQYHADRRSAPYGWGGTLYLQRRLYNVHDRDRLRIARQIINTGEIRSGISDGSRLTLTFQQLRDFDPDRHRLIAWLPDHSLVSVEPAAETQWQMPPVAVALAYDGKRIGAWWSEDWSEVLSSVNIERSGQVAAFLRWAQLPLLANQSLPKITAWAGAIPGRVLRAWLHDEFLAEALRWNPDEEGWREVVGTILRKWEPGEYVSRLQMHLGGTDKDPWVVADRLRYISPVLAARFLKHAFPSGRPAQPMHEAWGLVPESELLAQVANLTDIGIDEGMIQHRDRGLRALARTWRDCPEQLDTVQRRNLITATYALTPFRDLLSLDLLEGRL